MSKFMDLVKLGMEIDDKPMTADEYAKIRNEYGVHLNVKSAQFYLKDIRKKNKSSKQLASEEKEAKRARRLLVGLTILGTILYEGGKMVLDFEADYNKRHFPYEF